MTERPELNLHGKGLDAEEREKAAKHFEKNLQEGLEPVPGEIDKSGEIFNFIETINGYLNEELQSLGLGEVQLDARRIHVLPPEVFQREFPHRPDANGVYRGNEDGVYVEKDKSRLQAYKSLLHEVVHQIAFRSFFANPETRQTYTTRNGYTNEQANEENHEHFRGLNEAVVDSIVKEVFMKHKDELIKEFSISEEEQKESVSYYQGYMDILNIVMDKIAERNDESRESVWSRFKKGEFTGEMMHMRDVEKTFGKGALRVLAALGSGTKNARRSKLIEEMKEYFQTDDEAVRERLAKEILIERERLKYKEVRN